MCNGHDGNCNCDGTCGTIRAHVPGWDKMSQGTKERLTVLIKAASETVMKAPPWQFAQAEHNCRACGNCITEGCPTQHEGCPINKEKNHE